MLTHTFLRLVSRYTTDSELANDLWLEIFSRYSDSSRHYHNIDHLEKMLSELKKVKDEVVDWDTLVFALFYHDIIYKATAGNNEAESAKFAKEKLGKINLAADKISLCTKMILATKKHAQTDNPDINILLDADLSILGSIPYDYQKYTEAVRKEFSVYPDFLYVPGRKKVIQHFLQMDRIFKTQFFYASLEDQARQNLTEELASL